MPGGLIHGQGRTLLEHHAESEASREAVTETYAILGKRGAGKTTTAARVLTEELLHVVPALEPKGALLDRAPGLDRPEAAVRVAPDPSDDWFGQIEVTGARDPC